ncbi:Tetratricopeptide repeat protein 36 like protein [Trachymyrmex zeteki]|uniref:Tetratricopeptide repeat protein 36 like protein n=1 Tax=Mycetomoellerius zeteki TaxID=64791 RepID=A0A151XBB8_9HYME|nr:PREDICTED: tetratricopeptide repeat protein 36 homolog isoform X1 [Trachymyrmex zeteki]XP_018300480.1 PREDICTED: tetratricopeptide repeat protein 36 homolog isoform X1 [Trachymyrmex zeteki]KYQ57647.1 Tetratricopeptide repeat protein 36 like protein [Trachymyrmex zeteki]
MESLSEGDKAVLKTIFDPFQPLGPSDFSDFSVFQEIEETDVFEEDRLESDVLDIIKKAIVCAEAKNFDECFRLFDQALEKAPKSPSILNDRAQALRLANRHKEALKDLHLAVELSEGKGRVGIQALCQRGALYRWMEQDDKAREDFTRAAKAGSSFAKSQLVALNPYAAMCNAMLQKMTFKANQL